LNESEARSTKSKTTAKFKWPKFKTIVWSIRIEDLEFVSNFDILILNFMTNDINFFAETTARGQRTKFGINLDDRRRHMYVIGKTGMGKTQMLQNMAIQDIQSGKGVGIIDPHGEFAEALLDYVPKSRINDVVYFNPADTDMPIGFNIMEGVGREERYFIASGLMTAFEKVWADVWSERMKYILNNTILSLLEVPNSTILSVSRTLSDKDYRKKVVENVKDPAVKSFWINEFAKYPERYREEATGAIQNKIGQFISNPLIRHIVGQTKSSFNMRDIMDNEKILIMNLAKGRIGEDNTALLGTMLITKLQTAAMSRVDVPEEERKDFFLYVDEFQTFATPSFAGILSEARKYRLSLILAHQYITQMDEVVRDAVFGNAGTLVSFRIGAADAEFLEKEFVPSFMIEDLVNLTKFNIAIKLMIDGVASNAFSAQTLPPISFEDQGEVNSKMIIKISRERYGQPKEEIEEKILRWSGFGEEEERQIEKEKEFTHEAICAECNKNIKVSFEPDGRRPVYCKDCLPKKMRQRDMQRSHVRAERPVQKSTGGGPGKDVRELSLDEAMRKHPPQQAQGSGQSSPRPNQTITRKPRKEVDLQSLRETLSDVVPQKDQGNSTNSKDSGIIKEGDEINL